MYQILWKKTLACAVALSLTATGISWPTGATGAEAFAAKPEPVQRGPGGRRNRGGGGDAPSGGARQGRPQNAAPRGGDGGGRTRGGGPPANAQSGTPRSAPRLQQAPGIQRAPGLQRTPGVQGNSRGPGAVGGGLRANRGTIHVPPAGGNRNANRNITQGPSSIRTPSPTRPRLQSPGVLSGATDRPAVRGPIRDTAGNIRRSNPLSGTGNVGRDINRALRNDRNDPRNQGLQNPDRNNPIRSVTDGRRPDLRDGRNRLDRNDGPRNNNNLGNNTNINNNSIRLGNDHRNYSNYNNAGNGRRYNGNLLNFNNRQLNLGSSNYRPSHYRHNRYHGNWGGNNFGYGNSPYSGGYNGFGNGSGLNWGIGIGSGYGGYGNYGLNNYGFGNYGGYGRSGRGYRYRPFGWGLGGWGLGSLLYNSGYLRYSNPYYVSGGTTVYNYSQPIPVYYTTSEQTVTATTEAETADQILNNAIAEFQQNNYDAALDITNNGISKYPDDAVLHEFRSLVLFARQDYQQSTATIHSVLAVGPGWNWTTLASLYSDVSTYTTQLRDLEAFTRSNPQDAGARFLLGYHYMTCGHSDAAANQFQQVTQLQPGDQVASDLYRMLSPPSEDSAAGAQPPHPTTPAGSENPVVKVDPGQLVGQWKASRDDGSTFDLTLTNDSKFTWGFASPNQKGDSFSGTYTVEGNVLALERAEGGALIAEVAPEADGRLRFRLLGSPQDDPGLTFTR